MVAAPLKASSSPLFPAAGLLKRSSRGKLHKSVLKFDGILVTLRLPSNLLFSCLSQPHFFEIHIQFPTKPRMQPAESRGSMDFSWEFYYVSAGGEEEITRKIESFFELFFPTVSSGLPAGWKSASWWLCLTDGGWHWCLLCCCFLDKYRTDNNQSDLLTSWTPKTKQSRLKNSEFLKYTVPQVHYFMAFFHVYWSSEV